MIIHAAHVNSVREDAKREFEKQCKFCNRGEVVAGVCNACKRESAKINSGIKAQDRIQWPPNSGNWYVGDKKESALIKLKKADPRALMAYNQWVLTTALAGR